MSPPVTSEPIQPLHHPFMHMNEDNNIWNDLHRPLMLEDFNQGGGRDVCATKAISSRPRRRTVIPDWPEHVKFDEKEEAIAFGKHDVDGKRHLVRGPVQPRDVWNDRGLRYYVHFNDLNQPLRKGGCILVSFLGDIAKRETFCPVGVSSWHKLKKKMKADIVILVRIFLRENYFDPMTRTDDQNYDNRPDGVSKQNWINLVDYWRMQITRLKNVLLVLLPSQGLTLRMSFGVKQSDIFGVQGLLRKEGSSYVNHSAVQMENLKVEFSAVKKQNEDLRQKNLALESKFDDTAQSFKAIASHLAQVLKEVRNGNPSTSFGRCKSAIKLIDTQ
ncbi:WD repeat-containing protein 20-like protein, partial [Bienertia sinuspersici]